MSKTFLVSGFSFLVVSTLLAQDARQIVSESQKRGQSKSQQYEGTIEVIGASNKISLKRWIFQRTGSFGASKAILRFTAPAEVKGVALLIVNHPDRASDQWMWTPALERDRRIALQDRSTRFFGTDFSFEDLEERDVNQFDYKLMGEDNFDGQACWKIESKPKESKSSQYTSSVLLIRKDNYVVIQIDNFSKEKLVRRIHYTDVQQQDGIWAGRTMEVQDTNRNSRTVMKLEKLQYNVPMKDESFTLEALRRG
ncbi:MAG TPA: outer membrane lipoprotein-sorting protein [Bryobacteraceae bacterium]|nr:outer membrane lipoprotein-sorting protein [Bryobacteraceae bacterium]